MCTKDYGFARLNTNGGSKKNARAHLDGIKGDSPWFLRGYGHLKR